MFTRSHYQPDRTTSGPINRILRKLRKTDAPTVTPNWFYRGAPEPDFVFVPHCPVIDAPTVANNHERSNLSNF
jgi:hypothetical protein